MLCQTLSVNFFCFFCESNNKKNLFEFLCSYFFVFVRYVMNLLILAVKFISSLNL
ncbi:hypothetical protein l11_04120 [Neisseria weaveri LMG 5135]|nr:hypothetical protein l11_04120 [Neisseria weaveri LMG 5135]